MTNNCFVHDPLIPIPFALAIYAIIHNIATADDWELIDHFDDNGKPIIEWIGKILVDNGMQDNLDKEIEWWKAEINKR